MSKDNNFAWSYDINGFEHDEVHKAFLFPTTYLQGCMMSYTSKHNYRHHKWQLVFLGSIVVSYS